MQLPDDLRQLLLRRELLARQAAQQALIERDQYIQKLVQEYCEVDPEGMIGREEWQDFCFQKYYQRDCHTNIPFSTYLNEYMTTLGFSLGFAHTKIRVYRGLKWKVKS